MEEKEPQIEEAKPFDIKFKEYLKVGSYRWKNRRRMAWVALVAILVVTYWCMFCVRVDRLKELNDIITWFYLTMGSIIGAYVGFSTLDDKWKK